MDLSRKSEDFAGQRRIGFNEQQKYLYLTILV